MLNKRLAMEKVKHLQMFLLVTLSLGSFIRKTKESHPMTQIEKTPFKLEKETPYEMIFQGKGEAS